MANEDAGLLIRASGDAFSSQKYDLRSVDHVINNYRILLDQVVPFAIGQQRLSSRQKQEIAYGVEIRRGSLELYSVLSIAIPPVIAAASSDGGFQLSYQIAKMVHGIITLRRAWATIQKIADGKFSATDQPKLKLDVTVENVTQAAGSTLNVNPVVLIGAEATKHTIDRLVSGIDGNKLSSLCIDGGSGTKITLSHQDAFILGTDYEELPKTVDLIGKLYEVNFITKKGWLLTEGERVPVTWEESIRRTIKELADRPNTAFSVKPIVDHRRFANRPVGYHVVRVWVPQASLLAKDRTNSRRKRHHVDSK